MTDIGSPRLFQIEDLLQNIRILELSANAGSSVFTDGREAPSIVFTAKKYDISDNKSTTNLFVHYGKTFRVSQLTRGGKNRDPFMIIPTKSL